MRHSPRHTENLARPMAVELSVLEKRGNEALRKAVDSTTRKEFCPAAEDLRRQVFTKRRMFPVRHIMLILRDAFERGASESDVKAFVRWMDREITQWYRPVGISVPLPQAHLTEETAEAPREIAEVMFRNDPSPFTAHKLLEAIRAHEVATDSLEEVAASYLNNLQRVS